MEKCHIEKIVNRIIEIISEISLDSEEYHIQRLPVYGRISQGGPRDYNMPAPANAREWY